MTSGDRPTGDVAVRVFLIASAVVAMAALIVVAGREAESRSAVPESVTPALVAPDDAIADEADVFRTHAGVLAIDPGSDRRRFAHPRTLVTYRSLRAYPGAPPRIPHGLTPDEFQSGGCNTCHERGGFSQRFGAYVPITPHPQMGACLQCHVGNGELMAIALPSTDPSARCRQCHARGVRRLTEATLDWKSLAWPRVTKGASEDAPPPIPHTLEMRGNCVACHAPPAAVAEIQTGHPQRVSCRQCHVAAETERDAFVRPAPQPSEQEGTS